ncbi:MAG TPA: WecB/TagA/CpsF family glycosyltransferase [Blastococcus sp.]
MSLAGVRVDVMQKDDVLGVVAEHLEGADDRPLYVASANLDHIAHFGHAGASRDLVDYDDEGCRWLVLLDGVPLVWRSRRLLAEPVEQLAGSDLLGDCIHVAGRTGSRVGVLGGTAETHLALQQVLDRVAPELEVAGCWAPDRGELTDGARARALAQQIAAARVDLLVVALGKPRQEAFLAQHGAATGARVGLAFGAAIDFLAGRVSRAPEAVRHAGLEWLWRLAQEPGRLSHRYLVEGPPNVVALLRDASLVQGVPLHAVPAQRPVPESARSAAAASADRAAGSSTFR